MFNTAILDVAIGLIFIYLLLSLMCTAANEIIELLLKKRAIDLEHGIRELLDPDSKAGEAKIVQEFYDHPLINGLFEGSYEKSGIKTKRHWVKRTQLPSYIPARNFALALMDLIRPGVAAGGAVAERSGAADATAPSPAPPQSGPSGVVVNVAGVGAPLVVPPAPPVPNPSVMALRAALAENTQITEQVRRGLIPLVDAAGNDVAKVRENIETWYNASMDRVSSWYKRRAQVTILIIGLFVAITVNVDTVTIAKRLSTDKALRESLVAASQAYAQAHATASPTPKPSPEVPNATPVTGASRAATTGSAAVTNPGQVAPVASPSPSPETATSPSPKPAVSPSTVPVVSPSVAAVVSPSVVAVVSPVGSPSPSPVAPPIPECVKDATSAECKSAKRDLAHENACKQPVSEACKNAKKLQKACKNPNSAECKRGTNLLVACEASGSVECKTAKDLEKACEDPNSAACKRGTNLLVACEEPNSVECQSAKDLVAACEEPESPKCKYLANLNQIQALGLPIGWDATDDPKRTWPGMNFFQAGGWMYQIYWHAFGWILTALALSLGAPFWFDLLNKFIVIRSAVKPHEKSPEEGSKD